MIIKDINSPFYKPDEPKNNWDLFKWIIFEPDLLQNLNYNSLWDFLKKQFLFNIQIIIPITFILYTLNLFIISFFDLPEYFPEQFHNSIAVGWNKEELIWQKSFFLFMNSYSIFLYYFLFLFVPIVLNSYLGRKEHRYTPFSLGLIVFIATGCLLKSLALGIIMSISLILPLALILPPMKTDPDYDLPSLFTLSLIFFLEQFLTGGSVGFLANGTNSVFTISILFLIIGILIAVSFFLYSKYKEGAKNDIADLINASFFLGIIFWVFSFASGVATINENNILSGLMTGAILGVITVLNFIIFYLKIPLIIYYSFLFLNKNYSFYYNPYIFIDGIIKISWFEKPLFEKARTNKDDCIKFINFLMKYRDINKSLAAKLNHHIQSGNLEIATKLNSQIFENFTFIRIYYFYPSPSWFQLFDQLKSTLDFYLENKNESPFIKKNILQNFYNTLIKIIKLTEKDELKSWNYFYFKGFDNLQKITSEELLKVEQELLISGFNPYRRGQALNPDFDELVFKGRHDFKDEIATKVISSSQMHMLYIQGQRRIGKTSAIKFLEKLLDDSLKIIIQDLQKSINESIQKWLLDLKTKIENKLKIPKKEIGSTPIPENPLQAWNEFRIFLEGVIEGKDFKLLLVFDEYENLHKYIFSKMEHDLAQQILGDIRNFSQHQSQIILMFVGSALFTELVFYGKDPTTNSLKETARWSNFFPQIVRIPMDYLSEIDARDLILSPVPDLKYPEEVQKEIWNLTNGHPAIIQSICGELVDKSIKKNRNQLNMDDLNFVIQETILTSDMSPFNIFWDEFCLDNELKKTVLNLLSGEENLNQKHIMRLLEHKFIEETEKGKYQFRVKLFELWVKKYGYI